MYNYIWACLQQCLHSVYTVSTVSIIVQCTHSWPGRRGRGGTPRCCSGRPRRWSSCGRAGAAPDWTRCPPPRGCCCPRWTRSPARDRSPAKLAHHQNTKNHIGCSIKLIFKASRLFKISSDLMKLTINCHSTWGFSNFINYLSIKEKKKRMRSKISFWTFTRIMRKCKCTQWMDPYLSVDVESVQKDYQDSS